MIIFMRIKLSTCSPGDDKSTTAPCASRCASIASNHRKYCALWLNLLTVFARRINIIRNVRSYPHIPYVAVNAAALKVFPKTPLSTWLTVLFSLYRSVCWLGVFYSFYCALSERRRVYRTPFTTFTIIIGLSRTQIKSLIS